MTDNQNEYRIIWEQTRRLIKLQVENARFLAAEKLTVLLSSITFYAISAVIVTCVTIFLTIVAVHLMMEHVKPQWAYTIVAAFYLMLLLILILCKKSLIINPIARFISTVVLDPPQSKTPNDKQP